VVRLHHAAWSRDVDVHVQPVDLREAEPGIDAGGGGGGVGVQVGEWRRRVAVTSAWHGRATAVVIRDSREDDAAATLSIFERAVTQTARSRYSQEQVRAWLGAPRDREQWNADRLRVRTFVAEHAGAVVGFSDPDENGYVDRLFVAPEHGRRGVARALLRRVLATADELRLREVTTHASLVARPVFEREGFHVVHEEAVHKGPVSLTPFFMRAPRGAATPEGAARR
jgi:putative acetyltransferase